MECTNCGYPLWNLSARQCPECGTDFKPSDFELVANSVRFCCPSCDQSYYGTGEKGHLVPTEFQCIKCEDPLHMDAMVLRLAEGVEEASTRVDENPWIHRARIGRIRGWFKTVGMALASPGRLMIGTPMVSSTLQAWWFVTIVILLSMLSGFGVLGCTVGSIVANVPTGGTTPSWAALLSSMFGSGVIMSVAAMMGLAVWGLIAHGLLMMTGDRSGGLGRTMQAMCYAGGALFLGIIPCAGLMIGAVWWPISAVIALKFAQGVSTLRAAFAVLLLPLIGVGLYAALTVFAMILATSAPNVQITATAPALTRIAESQQMHGELLAYVTAHNGNGPAHAIELVAANQMGESNFVSLSTTTTTADVTIGDRTLTEFMLLQPNMKAAAVKEVVESMPADVVAHRVGDFVFTYHGINLDTADPRLWIVVLAADPAMNSTGRMTVIRADGAVAEMSGESGQHAEQNAVRAEFGLAPLPNLMELGNEPATAGQ